MKIYYDFHIHTNLSPCGDSLNTPNNIVNMAKIKGLDVIAITDHNSVGNVLPCMKVGEREGIVVIPGMELTTSEEIHVVCLFENIEDALSFGEYVKNHQTFVKNNEKIFGEQIYYNEVDEEVGRESRLLIMATDIGIYQLKDIVKKFNGIIYPAHIDRESNGIIGVLGEVPSDLQFNVIELSINDSEEVLNNKKEKYSGYNIVYSSDAHNIVYIAERVANYNEMEVESKEIKSILQSLNWDM